MKTDFNDDSPLLKLKAAQLIEIKKAFQPTDEEVFFLIRLHAGVKKKTIDIFL